MFKKIPSSYSVENEFQKSKKGAGIIVRPLCTPNKEIGDGTSSTKEKGLEGTACSNFGME